MRTTYNHWTILEIALINEIITPIFQPSKCLLIRKFIFGRLHRTSSDGETGLLPFFSKNKEVKNIIHFSLGGSGTEKSTILEFG